MQGISRSILLFLVAATIDSFGQTHLSFSKLGISDGLSDESINNVVQDSRGFIWIGTTNGLNRYDGNYFKIFQSDYEKPGALRNGNITALFVDRNNTLWVGTYGGGLYYYNPETESFFSCNTGSSSLIGSIYESSSGELWVGLLGTDGGLGLYDQKSDSLAKFTYKKVNPRSTKSTDYIMSVRTIKESRDNNLWLATWEDGILKFNPKTKIFTPVKDKRLSGLRILTLYIDSKNILWIGTFADGLIRFDPASGDFRTYKYSATNQHGPAGDRVSSICPENENLLWLATNGGLSLFDIAREKFKNYYHNFYDFKGLSDQFLNHLYKDRTGLLWIGTQFQGINTLRTSSYKFYTLQIYDPYDKNGLSHNNVTSFLEDTSGNTWVGTFGGGLNKQTNRTPGAKQVNEARFKWYQYHGTHNENFINTNGISCLMQDHEGNIWIAHGNGGINLLNPKTNQMESFRKNDNIGLTEDRINSIFQDSRERIWIATFSGGVNLFDNRKKRVAKVYDLVPNQKNTLRSNNPSMIFEDRNKNIWIGHRMPAGVDQYQEDSDNFLHLVVRDTGMIVFNNPRISSMVQGDSGLIWFGTNNGVYGIVTDRDTVINRAEGTINTTNYIRYSESNGLLSNEVSGIILHRNKLWVSTNRGVSQIDLVTNQITNFDENDGLQKGRFYPGAIIRKSTGHILIGGSNGISIFHPDSLIYNSIVPNIAITDMLVLNKIVKIDTSKSATESGNFTLPKSITNLDEIEIPYDLNVFGFHFAALDFTSPTKNQYAYQMEGFDREWVYAGNSRSAGYTNLDPGTYTFRVKGSNNDGIWNEHGVSLKITILPPPWKTWWAYVCYSIGFILLLLAGRNEIVKREQLKTKAKLKEAEAEKYHEMDTLKSRFFANISHEFRTPLTLLLGPIEKRLSLATKNDDKKELTIMHRNALRLLNLVNQLLDLSRLEAGTMNLRGNLGPLNEFIPSIASQFSSMADSKSIHFKVELNEPVTLFFDGDKMEKILTNLLSNSFKFTPSGGTITLALRQQRPTESYPFGYAKITVEDSGPGIETEHLDKIFDRFYQADSSNTRLYEGTGIGLALTKELVELHKGSISVTSTPGKGSCFVVCLPLGTDHLKNITVEYTNTPSAVAGLLPEPDEVFSADYEPKDSSRPGILVVEDNADLRFFLRSNLHDLYEIHEAADGEQGLTKALELIPDLIISDLMMPRIDGLQLCENLKQNEKTSHIPIILLTAKADIESKVKGLHLGADDYIAKPFDARELNARITNLIENRRKLQTKFSKQFYLAASEIHVESVEDKFIKKVKGAIEARLDDPALGVESLADDVAMSKIQLYRKVKALTGMVPNELIRNIRLERAASLLRQHAGNVSEIADQVGFNNLSYFSKCFREKYGVSPSEFN